MPMLSCSFKGQAGDTNRSFCTVRFQFGKVCYRRARRSVVKTDSAAVRLRATLAKIQFSLVIWPLRQSRHAKIQLCSFFFFAF
jgi:hypothetical protein